MLVTARTVEGHDEQYHFTTLPLVFVVSLLQTLDATRRLLMDQGVLAAMPPILIVMETNFAYGAAVYMQMVWLLEERIRQHPGLRDLDVIFGTPVYMWDDEGQQLSAKVPGWVRERTDPPAAQLQASLRKRTGRLRKVPCAQAVTVTSLREECRAEFTKASKKGGGVGINWTQLRNAVLQDEEDGSPAMDIHVILQQLQAPGVDRAVFKELELAGAGWDPPPPRPCPFWRNSCRPKGSRRS